MPMSIIILVITATLSARYASSSADAERNDVAQIAAMYSASDCGCAAHPTSEAAASHAPANSAVQEPIDERRGAVMAATSGDRTHDDRLTRMAASFLYRCASFMTALSADLLRRYRQRGIPCRSRNAAAVEGASLEHVLLGPLILHALLRPEGPDLRIAPSCSCG